MKLGTETNGMMNDNKLRNRQESTDSLDSSSQTVEEYSSDEDTKDELSIDDFQIIKTVGKYYFLFFLNYIRARRNVSKWQLIVH